MQTKISETKIRVNERMRAQLRTRTQLRAGKEQLLSQAGADVSLTDRVVFVVLDALQKPTNALFALLPEQAGGEE